MMEVGESDDKCSKRDLKTIGKLRKGPTVVRDRKICKPKRLKQNINLFRCIKVWEKVRRQHLWEERRFKEVTGLGEM